MKLSPEQFGLILRHLDVEIEAVKDQPQNLVILPDNTIRINKLLKDDPEKLFTNLLIGLGIIDEDLVDSLNVYYSSVLRNLWDSMKILIPDRIPLGLEVLKEINEISICFYIMDKFSMSTMSPQLMLFFNKWISSPKRDSYIDYSGDAWNFYCRYTNEDRIFSIGGQDGNFSEETGERDSGESEGEDSGEGGDDPSGDGDLGEDSDESINEVYDTGTDGGESFSLIDFLSSVVGEDFSDQIIEDVSEGSIDITELLEKNQTQEVNYGDGEGRLTPIRSISQDMIDTFKVFLSLIVNRRKEFYPDSMKHHNRNSRGRDLMYSSIKKKIRNSQTKLGIIIDTSGSIPVEYVGSAVSAINEVISLMSRDSKIIFWDTHFCGECDLFHIPKDVQTGGGTNLSGSVEMLHKEGFKDIVIYSDFCTSGEYMILSEIQKAMEDGVKFHFFLIANYPSRFSKMEDCTREFHKAESIVQNR